MAHSFTIFLSIFSCVLSIEEDIETVQVELNGDISLSNIESEENDNTMEVEFENQSGDEVELWKDAQTELFLIASFDDDEKIILDVHIGDDLYFTSSNSGGSRRDILLEIKLDETTTSVLLGGDKTTDDEEEYELGCDEEENECVIRVDNEYGSDIKVWWDDGKEGVLQGVVLTDDFILLNTMIGHSFFATTTMNMERIYSFTFRNEVIMTVTENHG